MSEKDQVEHVLTHVCRKCSAQSEGTHSFCPNCGKSFERGGLQMPSRKMFIIGVLVVIVIAGGATGMVVKNSHDSDVAATKVAAKKSKLAAERSRVAANEAAADQNERENRADQVKDLEGYIKKDAKKLVKQGVLDGPILSGSCTATGGGSTDDLTALTGTFGCMAVHKENKDGTMSGYSYAGTIDWKAGEYTWQLGG